MKKMLLCSLVLVCVTFLGCNRPGKVSTYNIKLGSEPTVTPEPGPYDWWPVRHESIVNRAKQGNVDMILIGDSITHNLETSGKEVWDKYYAPRNTVNMGFSSDKTQNVIWRLLNGEIDGINPKLAVIMIGTNNCQYDSPREIANGVIKICQILREKLPNTNILLLAIFPRTDVPNGIKVNSETSMLYSEIADNKWIYFLNINGSFLGPDSVLRTDIFPDKLHPNAQGTQIWAAAMEPIVKQLMSETK